MVGGVRRILLPVAERTWLVDALRAVLGNHFPPFAILAYGSISDVTQAGVPNLSACDICFANLFLAVQILFLATVTWTNWSLLKKPEMPEL